MAHYLSFTHQIAQFQINLYSKTLIIFFDCFSNMGTKHRRYFNFYWINSDFIFIIGNIYLQAKEINEPKDLKLNGELKINSI